MDHNKNIKVADFGLSNLYEQGELLKTACGSPCYAAPEMLEGNNYKGLSVDIWSSGIILYAMVCGYLPFEDKNTNQLYAKIKKGIFEIPHNLSDMAKHFLQIVLEVNPDNRVTIPQMREHPWFNISKIDPKIQKLLDMTVGKSVDIIYF